MGNYLSQFGPESVGLHRMLILQLISCSLEQPSFRPPVHELEHPGHHSQLHYVHSCTRRCYAEILEVSPQAAIYAALKMAHAHYADHESFSPGWGDSIRGNSHDYEGVRRLACHLACRALVVLKADMSEVRESTEVLFVLFHMVSCIASDAFRRYASTPSSGGVSNCSVSISSLMADRPSYVRAMEVDSFSLSFLFTVIVADPPELAHHRPVQSQ
jgi:hypothetical protein